jgi:hypothetical protein
VTADASPGLRNPRVVWAGSAAALVTVLGLSENHLEVFNLRPEILKPLTLLLAMSAVALGTLSERRVRRSAKAELDDALDDALACWPTRRVRELSPYDVGVRPTLAASDVADHYVERKVVDDKLAEALNEGSVVVAFGPAGSGASRAAFEAVRAWNGDALMLIPEHAEGLRTMLKRADQLAIGGRPAVVWLDDLERYVTGLDLDPLERLLRRHERQGAWPGRLFRRLFRRPRKPALPVRLVATIHDDAITALLQGERRSYPAQRLLTQARGVAIPGALDGEERRLYREHFDHEPPGSTVAAAFDAEWNAGWLRCPPSDQLHPKRSWLPTINGTSAVLAIAVFAIAVWLAVAADRFGWTVPPSLADQVLSLTGQESCPADAYPSKGEGLTGSGTAGTLVVLVHGADCARSDVLRFYRDNNGRLTHVLTLTPPAGGSLQSFECLGPVSADPCHVKIQGRSSYIVGAFRDAENRQALPVALSFDHGFRAWALLLPAAAAQRAPQLVRTLALAKAPLALGREGRGRASTKHCVPSGGCVLGRRAQAFAVVPRESGPAVLLAAYAASGTPQVPRRMRLQVWHLAVVRGRPKVDRSCVVLRDGRRVPASLAGNDDAGALHQGWRPKRSELMC